MCHEIDFRATIGDNLKRLLWLTDLHLDAADRVHHQLFVDLMLAHEPDLVLIGGDICNGSACFSHLQQLASLVDKPFYFVLGNHDFYYSSIEETRDLAKKIHKENSSLHYLTHNGIVPLTKNTVLIGHDGWSDARCGDFFNSTVMLNDYFLIEDLKRLNHEERFEKLQELGMEAANFIKKQLIKTLQHYQKVILLTHVPPFEESCLYEGIQADQNRTPHFVCKASGEAIESVMKNNPDKELLVLCGHSHWRQDIQILPNLRVVTGHSELGIPDVQGLIYVD